MAEILEFDEMFYTSFEPKVQNRFKMVVDGLPSYLIKASARPSVQTSPITIDHMNVQRKLKGKTVWQPISITLYDPIVPSAAQAVMEWVRLSHESVTGRDGYADFYKKDVDLYGVGPVGDVVEHWKIKGAWISDVNFGEFDWSSAGDPMEVQVTLEMDYAILEF